jgi:hypothetical protein
MMQYSGLKRLEYFKMDIYKATRCHKLEDWNMNLYISLSLVIHVAPNAKWRGTCDRRVICNIADPDASYTTSWRNPDKLQ